MAEQNANELPDAIQQLVNARHETWTRFVNEQWATTTNIREMVRQVELHPLRVSERKLRLFAAACCWRIEHLLPDAETRRVLRLSEQCAEGFVTAAEMLWAAEQSIRPRSHRQGITPQKLAHSAVLGATTLFEPSFGYRKGRGAVMAATFSVEAVRVDRPGAEVAECEVQANLLRDIVGNPRGVLPIDPAWLEWHNGTVANMAQVIYAERTFEHLPILADALEEAGCTDAELLEHLRSPGPHVRGCYAVDLLLGRS